MSEYKSIAETNNFIVLEEYTKMKINEGSIVYQSEEKLLFTAK